MMNRLWVRLWLGFLLVVAIGIGLMSVAVSRATEASFRGYVHRQNMADMGTGDGTLARLEDHYAQTGSWEGAQELLPGQGRGQGQGQGMGMGMGQGARFLLADSSGRVVAATDPQEIGARLSQAERNTQATALAVDGRTVGYLLQETPSGEALTATQADFLQEIRRWLWLVGLGAAAVALLLGSGLAWQLTRPLRALTSAARRMAEGELDQRVRVVGTQETAELAEAFNRLSSELVRVETLRQRMTADVAHELRTPVSVMRAQLEGMLDGVLPSDTSHIAVVYDQSLHLARLVDDLRTLTQAEAGQLLLSRAAHDPATLVERARASFEALADDAGNGLSVEVAPGLPPVQVDADRIQQVFANLLSNALRHTPSDGEIHITARQHAGGVRFGVSNTGPGLTAEQAAQVFERFWRAEAARERDRGGAGLGLAIARSLVTLHGGRIWVEAAPELTTFKFELPVDDK